MFSEKDTYYMRFNLTKDIWGIISPTCVEELDPCKRNRTRPPKTACYQQNYDSNLSKKIVSEIKKVVLAVQKGGYWISLCSGSILGELYLAF